MNEFKIKSPDQTILDQLVHKVNNKTKPKGSLGVLEAIAIKIGVIQQTLRPQLCKPTIALFAADHGIAEEGVVNPNPQEVTWQMVYNFISGGAGINVFTRQHHIALKVIDSGVKYDFNNLPGLIDEKIDFGTKNYLYQPAMTKVQCEKCLERGAALATSIYSEGSNIIGFGEMGIGNTSSASLLMSKLLGIPIEDCVGMGAGLDSEGVKNKKQVLRAVIEKHSAVESTADILQTFGGFEIAMIAGAMLQAAELKMILLIDGFIITAALLVASKLNPKVIDYCIFSHTSGEPGHQKLLDYFGAKPLLNLGLRLGEGTGAAIAFPLVQSAVNLMNELASFDIASVSNIGNE
ncbi:nicotinate-nucleotide--dimethylbenzimidazole phosphoribosyltransferase [Formosa sediminum]|uniref:Nicotinate-nucleotide--dimethylbenzimidazole phosphoribosyltransferase n=1 Tax=Formosa sediminum TaxID=2594004 RepID=A0A516GSE7_9FLAO|nr:nicotinate-nucleotide--dimethylbenzimidazole phosphoribosyltransferase [Formosa sediminum]QDO94428.1 nicotinate-nucleotide--dimethylbenzimidazole phosphoribosyltransferase [Formosa sediminum]